MAIGDMWKVTQVVTGVGGSPYYLSAYFDQQVGPASAAATAWRTFLAPTAANLQTGTRYEPITQVDIIASATGQPVGFSPVAVAALDGSSTVDRTPPQTQGVMRWRTGVYVSGRQVAGRTFLPDVSAGFVNVATGQPTSTYRSAVDARAATLIADSSAQLVIFAKKSGQFFPVTAGSMWDKFGTLKSRRD